MSAAPTRHASATGAGLGLFVEGFDVHTSRVLSHALPQPGITKRLLGDVGIRGALQRREPR